MGATSRPKTFASFLRTPIPPPKERLDSQTHSQTPLYPRANCPPTPPAAPANLQPSPLRYPETLGTLLEILPTATKGLGVFALVDIPAGTILLSEAPLITLIDTGTRADPLDAAVAALTPAQRASFLSLSYYSRTPHESVNRSIVYSNGYSIHADLATGLFETASRINHSCVPNCAYVWKKGVGRMVFWSERLVRKGEEICVDYGHRLNQLRRIYGFDCDCGGCKEMTSDGDVGSVTAEKEFE